MRSPAHRTRDGLLLVLVLVLLLPGGAGASLGDHPDPVVRALWSEGVEFEVREALVESSRRYEEIAVRLPRSAFIRWRLSRNYWRLGERLPVEDKAGRLDLFVVADGWADQALSLDPECGECVMWKLSSLGRIATTRGVVQSARAAPEIARLIDRGIALRPTHADGPDNVTLANLYYAGAAFYRVVPDWWWLPLVIGVRGDNHKALDYIHKAIEISGRRLDYQVEMGAVLLCIGTDDEDPARIEEGKEILRRAVELDGFQTTDESDREHARVLLREPDRACGYSRDGWIELEEAETRRMSSSES